MYLISLASQFAVEAAQRDAKRLDGAHRIVEVAREHVLVNAAELHHNVVDLSLIHISQGIVR